MNKPYKLLAGSKFYPIRGYEIFKGYFQTIQNAKEFIEKETFDNDCIWAQIVCEDNIILIGSKDIIDRKWQWKEYEVD